MRFDSLLFPAYGPFTDLSLDVSGGSHGLHIIYGPNEAGKSTSLRGMKAFFEGFPHRTSADFQHKQGDLRVGLSLVGDGGDPVTLLRRKGRKDTLLGPNNQPVADTTLQRLMGGMEPSVYTSRFVLGYDELVQGGADLLADKGDVAQSLFAAGLGGSRLRALIEAFDEQMQKLFRPRGQVYEINAALKGYKGARSLIKEKGLKGRVWAERRKALDGLEVRKKELEKRRGDVIAQRERLERLLRNLPRLARYQAVIDELNALGEVPRVRPDLGDVSREAQNTLRHQREVANRAQAQVERIEQEIEAVSIPKAVLAARGAIESLKEERGKIRKAQEDKRRQAGKRNTFFDERDGILATLPGSPSPDEALARLPDTLARGQLDELRESRQALLDAHSRGAQQLDEAQERVEKLQKELQKTQGAVATAADPSALARALKEAQAEGDIAARLSHEAAELTAQRGALRDAQSRLRPPLPDGAIAAQLPIPGEESIRQAERLMDAQSQAQSRAGEALAKAEAELRDIDEQLDAMRRAAAVPTEAELAAARSQRDQTWGAIRQAWLGEAPEGDRPAAEASPATADSFEGHIHSADTLADRLRADADRVSRWAALQARRARLSEEISAQQQAQAAAQAERERLLEAWQETWAAAGIAPTSPQEMLGWRQDFDRIVERQERIDHTATQLGQREARATALRDALSQALGQLGEAHPPETSLVALVSLADEKLKAINEAQRAQAQASTQLEEAQSALSKAERQAAAASRAWLSWEQQWTAALKPLGLPPQTHPRGLGQLLASLDRLAELQRSIIEVTRRIEAMERDEAAFADDVQALQAHLGLDDQPDNPLDAAAAMSATLTRALEDEAATKRLRQEVAKERGRQEEAKGHIREAQATLATLCQEAGVEDASALPEIEARVKESARLGQKRDTLVQAILDDGGGAPLAAIIDEAAGLDPHELSAQLAELKASLSELETERSELDVKRGALHQELEAIDGRSEAAEAAEEAQGHAARITHLSERYAQLTLAKMVLRQEMEAYRKAHEGPILERARGLFAQFTLGSFDGLEADWDEHDRPILKGRRPDRQRVGVEGMSDGTRDQLYLALRLASIEHQVKASEALPLIVDDILITADDDRAKVILEALADLSHTTQVIFFTHHQRLVEMGRALGRDDVFCHQSL